MDIYICTLRREKIINFFRNSYIYLKFCMSIVIVQLQKRVANNINATNDCNRRPRYVEWNVEEPGNKYRGKFGELK